MPTRPDVAQQLLGLLACGEVFGFLTMADAAARSEDLGQTIELMAMANAHSRGYERTRERLLEAGVDADAVIASHTGPLALYHRLTAPADEAQALLKAYVGTGIAADFVREMAANLDDQTRDFVIDVLAGVQAERVVVPKLRAQMAADERAAGPMALWGRRLMGEAISQAQRVAVDRPELVALMLGDGDLEGFQQMVARMTSAHTQRMRALGLYA